MPSLKYGGYVQYPLSPKDIKNISAKLEKYVTPDDFFSLLQGNVQDGWGVKIEPVLEDGTWKVVLYNLNPVADGDEHAYYVSGESATLLKAFVVAVYKRDQTVRDMPTWVKGGDKKPEFR